MSEPTTQTVVNPAENVSLAASDVHPVLFDEHRREIAAELADHQAPVDLEEIAEPIATRLTAEGSPSRDALQSASIALHHNHLPKLADAGLIEYDPAARRIDSVSRPIRGVDAP